MADLRRQEIIASAPGYSEAIARIESDHDRKVKQYAGEGATFFLIILVGAILVYRAVKKQLKISQEQQHFMMAITHELKTPIAVSKLNLETMQKRKLDEEQQQRLLRNTLHETERLDALCNNLLVSSQMESEGYKILKDEINFSSLVASCINDFNIRFSQRNIVEEIAEDVIVSGDPMLLQIVVNNLLENALKYSPKEALVKISLQQNLSFAELKVIDKGPGIAATDKKKVFEKFHRLGNEATKRAKGTGLGLYLCKKIVIRHEGSVLITDNPQGGSIFTVQLKATD
ncbi:MAG: two-component sensor histidine kinase [Rhizobacter sp.]|nr:two-component sensor histidine kinase [Ferruginibacter sp.]